MTNYVSLLDVLANPMVNINEEEKKPKGASSSVATLGILKIPENKNNEIPLE